MLDVLGTPIRAGDLCAVSARIGKHDSCIKLLYVLEILDEAHPDYGTPQEFIRGLDGAGRLTQVQKASNIVVLHGAVDPDHPRLRHLRAALDPETWDALRARLQNDDSLSRAPDP